MSARLKNLVCFSHGKESGPWGTKIKRLAHLARASGFQVISLDYQGIMDPEERVGMLLAQCPKAPNLVLVGSSMGGYVSAVASRTLRPRGLFLLAPAVYCRGYKCQSPQAVAGETTIIHGWDDKLIAPEKIFRYSLAQKAQLHLLNDGHRLLKVLPEIEKVFVSFLQRVLKGIGPQKSAKG